jgi:putative spermidine/putrescine transport system substrate-binding protein
MTEPTIDQGMSRRRLLRMGAGVIGTSALAPTLLAACGSSGSSGATNAATSTTAAGSEVGTAVGGPALLAAAKAEGSLTTAAIGAPHSYYVGVIDAFQKYAGFDVDVKFPTYPPPQEVTDLAEARQAKKKSPYDVVELSADSADAATRKALLTNYKSTLWDDIPSNLKDPSGAWSAAYFGTLSFVTNVTAAGFAPKSWAELEDKGGKDALAILGDPRSGQPLAGGLSLLTIMSAARANGGSFDDVAPGIDLLGALADKGIFNPLSETGLVSIPDTAGSPLTPINALFSFDFPLGKFNGNSLGVDVQVTTPSDGLVASFYPQAIAIDASHPKAARLWIEFLQSDQGAEAFLRNHAIPARHSVLRSKASPEVRKLLPSEETTNAPVPTQAQLAKAQGVIDAKWAEKIPTK